MNFDIIVSKIIDNTVIQLKKEKNMDKINKEIIEQIISNTMYQIYPYFIFFLIIMMILFIVMFLILFLNIKMCYKKNLN